MTLAEEEAEEAELAEVEDILELVDAGALFALGDSGGKDSQAMRIKVAALVPREQLLVVHASLGSVEWPGALEHARAGAERAGAAFVVARARKTFFDLVRHRASLGVPAFPLPEQRQCTSDLKRDPIVREVRAYAKARGFRAVVTCMGLRAEESPRRRRRRPLVRSERYSTRDRAWWEWLPVHRFTERQVFATIRAAGESPHPAYALGNRRLSCLLCIYGHPGDLRNGALADPENFSQYVALERETGYTCHQSRRPLEEVAGLTVEEARRLHDQRRRLPVVQPQPAGAGGGEP